MFSDAWEVLESLPHDDVARLLPEVIAARLRACTGLSKWNMGRELCRFAGVDLKPGLREAIGRFYLAYAEYLAVGGDMDTAKSYLQEMARVWPEGRVLVLETKALRELWE
jgi:hypothetical protein